MNSYPAPNPDAARTAALTVKTPEWMGAPPVRVTEAVEMALEDADQLRLWCSGDTRTAKKYYYPNAGHWHGKCQVCLAGMVMAVRFTRGDDTVEVTAESFEPRWEQVFEGIEAVRGARWEEAAKHLWEGHPGGMPVADEEVARFGRWVAQQLGDEPYGRHQWFSGWESFGAFEQCLRDVVLPVLAEAEEDVLHFV